MHTESPCRCDWHLTRDNLTIARYILADLTMPGAEVNPRTVRLVRQLEQRLVDRLCMEPAEVANYRSNPHGVE
jgi:hypothetical protein